MTRRWVCLDVGETLIDETRVWSLWADELGIPRLTFMAALGAEVARGGEHGDVFGTFGFGREQWMEHMPAVEERYRGFLDEDLYPDARRTLAALEAAGYRVAVAANQPAARAEQLRMLGISPEVLVMSDELGATKPAPEFYTLVLQRMGDPDPADVAYVGDRLDNDVVPAAAAGMRAIWIRRGPWGVIQRPAPDLRPALTVRTLDELAERIAEAWPA
jgi:HAD superfamily hydrolase (TIGR01662 family)